jgi:hypothetical protein
MLKLLGMHRSPTFSYFLSLRSRYSPQHSVLNTLNSCSSRKWSQSFTTIQSSMYNYTMVIPLPNNAQLSVVTLPFLWTLVTLLLLLLSLSSSLWLSPPPVPVSLTRRSKIPRPIWSTTK